MSSVPEPTMSPPACTIHLDRKKRLFFHDSAEGVSSYKLNKARFDKLFGTSFENCGLKLFSSGVRKGPSRKGRVNGYQLFVREFNQKSDKKDGKFSGTEMMRKAAEEWKGLSDAKRDDFRSRAKKIVQELDEKTKGEKA